MIEYLTSTTNVTAVNICDVCVFNEDECNEYRVCCYNEYLQEIEDFFEDCVIGEVWKKGGAE